MHTAGGGRGGSKSKTGRQGWKVHGTEVVGVPAFALHSSVVNGPQQGPHRQGSDGQGPHGQHKQHEGPSFSAYDEDQARLVDERMQHIMKDAERMNMTTVEPTLQRRKDIVRVVKEHVRKMKRKVYGGVAINEFIRLKNEADAFYDDDLDVPDIDFYSPDPVADLKAICLALKNIGISPVEGREAQHVDTFTIFACYWKCCDISYVPKIVYNRIPTDVLPDGLQYVRPSFMFIDFLRIINDPLMSYWRLDKNFPRFAKLQKFYPMEAPTKRITDIHETAVKVFGGAPAKNELVARILRDFLPGSSAVIVGCTAYHALMAVAASGSSRTGTPTNRIAVHESAGLLELLTVEYAADVAKLFGIIKAVVPGVLYQEYHPFYDFLGHRGHFLTPGGELLLRVFDNKHKCVPFMELPVAVPVYQTQNPQNPQNPQNQSASSETIQARVGTFTVIVMFMMIMRFRVRVENNGTPLDALAVHMYDNIVSNMYQVRNAYLKKHGATILDDTPFKEFVIPCVGEAMHALRINQLMQEIRYRKYQFRGIKYNPYKNTELNVEDFKFLNTSGNIINAPKDKLFDPEHQPKNSDKEASLKS